MNNIKSQFPAHECLFRYIDEHLTPDKIEVLNPLAYFGMSHGSIHDIKAEFNALRDMAERYRAALERCRTDLLKCGFIGKSEHGTGDPEINHIDEVLNGS